MGPSRSHLRNLQIVTSDLCPFAGWTICVLTTVLVEVTVMRVMAAVPASLGGGGRPASCQPAPTTAMGMGAATVPHNSVPVMMATQVGVGGATQVGWVLSARHKLSSG